MLYFPISFKKTDFASYKEVLDGRDGVLGYQQGADEPPPSTPARWQQPHEMWVALVWSQKGMEVWAKCSAHLIINGREVQGRILEWIFISILELKGFLG